MWVAQWCTMMDETVHVAADDDGGEWDGIMVERGRDVAMWRQPPEQCATVW